MNVRSPRTSFSATPTLPTGPFTACASRLEDQFSRVVARQNVQDDERELFPPLSSMSSPLLCTQSALNPMDLTKTSRRAHRRRRRTPGQAALDERYEPADEPTCPRAPGQD